MEPTDETHFAQFVARVDSIHRSSEADGFIIKAYVKDSFPFTPNSVFFSVSSAFFCPKINQELLVVVSPLTTSEGTLPSSD